MLAAARKALGPRAPCPLLTALVRPVSSIPEQPPRSGQHGAERSANAQQSAAPPLPPPLLAGGGPEGHWLDRYAPGARHWLEDKNRTWWIKGLVAGRCKQFHQLAGWELELRAAIEAAYQAAMLRHAAAAVDERAETHVQAACLALATHKVLLPYLRDEAEVLQIVREHMGGKTAAALRFLLKATKFLHRDGYATLAGRLRGLQMDWGAGFESRMEQGEAESSLTITRCLYNDLFTQEGKPQLAGCCCCSQDQVRYCQHGMPCTAGL